MILANNGVKLNVEVVGRSLQMQVLAQSKDATQYLHAIGQITDEETGLSIRSNKKPSFNHKTKRFFLRGTEQDHQEKVVEAQFPSTKEAKDAIAALDRMLDEIGKVDLDKVNHQGGEVVPGG